MLICLRELEQTHLFSAHLSNPHLMEWQDDGEWEPDPYDTLDEPLNDIIDYPIIDAFLDADVEMVEDEASVPDVEMNDYEDDGLETQQIINQISNDVDMDGGSNELEFVLTSAGFVEEDHPRLRYKEYRRTFQVQHNLSNVNIMAVADAIDDAFASAVDPIRSEAASNDLISVAVHHSDLNKSIYTRAHK